MVQAHPMLGQQWVPLQPFFIATLSCINGVFLEIQKYSSWVIPTVVKALGTWLQDILIESWPVRETISLLELIVTQFA